MEPSRLPDSLGDSLQLPRGEDNQLDLATLLGAGPDMPDRREYLFFFIASILVFLGILAFLGYIFLEPVRYDLHQAFLEPERLRSMAEYFGYWAQLLIIMVHVLEVLTLMPIPAEIASGFLFGLPWGIVYSILGLALGSLLAFLLGRWLVKKYINRLVNPNIMKFVRKAIKRQGTLAAFLFFLLPGVPKDFFCYLFGATRISLPFFLAATTLARLPGTILLNFQGAQAYKGYYTGPILLCLYIVLGFILYRNRESVYRWVNRKFLEDD